MFAEVFHHVVPLDEQGEPGRREVFRRFQPGEGIPDGA
ncbi:SMP-30/gluconolactonase/LRE family protein, partial [Klebsiella pneumoniae]|nr:SMP-30/gluconolactonase/LRE family protein [Klebsiella pneumoniae]